MPPIPRGFKKVRWRPVQVTFLDHCMQPGINLSPVKCQIWGMLIAECNKAYYVASWLTNNQVDDNMESFTILRDAVLSLNTLDVKGAHRGRKKKKAR